MTLSFLDASVIAMGAALTAVIWWLRTQSRAESVKRIAQLSDAAELLELHAAALDRFPNDPAAPVELKARLLIVSDALAEREVVKRLVEWEKAQPFGVSVNTPETIDLELALDHLRAIRPDLAQDFVHGVATAALGGLLRWPETAAKCLSKSQPGCIAQPKREAVVAVMAAKLARRDRLCRQATTWR